MRRSGARCGSSRSGEMTARQPIDPAQAAAGSSEARIRAAVGAECMGLSPATSLTSESTSAFRDHGLDAALNEVWLPDAATTPDRAPVPVRARVVWEHA